MDLKDDNNDIASLLLKPLKIYAQIDNIKPSEVYKQMRVYFDEFVKHVQQQHGYVPTYLLYFFYMPCIYHMYENNFKAICNELHLDPINFNKQDNPVEYEFAHGYLKQEHNDIIHGWYIDMVNSGIIKDIKPGNFVSSILEISTEEDKGGHAVTLLKGLDSNYYILDDDKCADTISNWYNTSRKYKILEVSIRDLDQQTVDDLNNILGKGTVERRLTRYVLNYGKTMSMSGGNIEITGSDITQFKQPDPIINVMMFMLFMLVVVLAVYEITSIFPLRKTVERYVRVHRK